MDVNVSVKIKASPQDTWAVFKSLPRWQEWYGLPITAGDWYSGGQLSYAAHDGIAAGSISLTDYTEDRSVTFSGPWADEIWSVFPDPEGCVFTKRIIPKNGANFTADGYPKECAKQQAYLEAFKKVVENSVSQALTDKKPPKKKNKALPFILIGAAVLLLGLAAASYFLFLRPYLEERARVQKYNEGAACIENGDYEKAREIFTELGDYDDSASLLAYAERGIAYQAAKKLMKSGEYSEAAKQFEELNGFKDSDERAAECRAAVAYEEGIALFEQEDFDGAAKKFAEAGDYEDAAARAEEARKAAEERRAAEEEARKAEAYEHAVALFDSGDYEEAARAFDEISGYKDSQSYLMRCEEQLLLIDYQEAIAAHDFDEAERLLNTDVGQRLENRDEYLEEVRHGRLYEEAVQDFNDELYYTAYEKFLSLGSFEDARDLAEQCIQTTPSTGETYHNPLYASSSLRLTIDPNRNDGYDTYFKIYAVSGSDEILVSCVYIHSGVTSAVWLPAGTYVLKTSSGNGSWFGEKEMFGDEGRYTRLLNGSTDRFVLEQNGDYLLTLITEEGGNVGSDSEDREDF